ncbi:MAG: hypothetical protein K2X98_02955 [Alphaproteobacteria bacterium]|nr:hypothetical protein [Alphaproteobacteria bacterium]MBX9977192.1 hypothetical protein [Alphaproteobacteria bacterium]
MLAPVDFAALYRQQQEQQTATSTTNAEAAALKKNASHENPLLASLV